MGILFLSSGHGGSDPGACGNGLSERDFCNNFVNKVSWVLDNCFVYRSQFRHIRVPNGPDANSDVNGAVDFVNENHNPCENTLAIDYHLNAFGDPNARGWEILCYNDHQSTTIANNLANRLKPVYNSLDIPFRGVKNGSQFGFIGRTAPTAFIFELAFLTNPREAEILKSWNGSESLVYSHAKALLNTLGVQYDIKAGSKIML